MPSEQAPARAPVRAGWDADARRLHAAGDDHLAWPEIANDADKGLRWAKR